MLLLTPISLHHIIQVPNNGESAEKQMEGSWVCVLAAHSCPTLCDPIDWGWPGSSCSWNFPARILEWVAIPFSRVSSRPRDQTGSPTLQTDFLPSEPLGKMNCAKLLCYQSQLFILLWCFMPTLLWPRGQQGVCFSAPWHWAWPRDLLWPTGY